ncbi:MAG: hypothetical protein JXB49_08595 [Bacteroidales bacterium]|nr:hypothetical protein [Bacteroidales bacterium]
MESHNFEKQIQEKIQIDSSQYATEAENAKNRVWNHVSSEISRQKGTNWIFAVASVIAVIVLSSFYYMSMQKKNREINRLSVNIINLIENTQKQQEIIAMQSTKLQNVSHRQDAAEKTTQNQKTQPSIIERIKVIKDTIIIYKQFELPYIATNVADTTWKKIVIADTAFYQEKVQTKITQSKEFILTENRGSKNKSEKSNIGFKVKFGNKSQEEDPSQYPIALKVQL